MKFSIQAQIEEVDREIAMRRQVYPRQVRSGSMRQSVADYHVARMEAVKVTLEWLRDNEAEIRAHVEAQRKTPSG